jgi:putative transposase
LYPTFEQEQRLVEALDGCRWVYNCFINIGLSSEYEMSYALTELKEQEAWLYNYHSEMLQMVSNKVAASFKALSALKRRGHRIGRLRYLTHEEYNSFTNNQSGFKITRHGNTDLLWLSKIGYIEIRLHRQPVNIKQVTVCRKNGYWYALIAYEIGRRIFSFIDPQKAIGIDVGIAKFSHDSDNYEIENPLFLKQMLKPLRRAHRRLSRRQKDSKNYNKAKSWAARLHGRIARQRNDFLHKTSTYYACRYDIIFLERLRTLNIAKNRRVARYMLDSGWRTFKLMLEYKARMTIEVDPAYTSVNCPRCHNQVPKTLAMRTLLRRMRSCD